MLNTLLNYLLPLYPLNPTAYPRYWIIVFTKSIGWVMAVATEPANNDKPNVCKYEGYQNLLNDPVVASIIFLYLYQIIIFIRMSI